MKNEIKELQDSDPLWDAEKITGKSYKESKATKALGFLMHLEKGNKMRELMESTDDTKFSETVEEYIRKITDFGFEQILKEDFQAKGWGDDLTDNSLYIFWHKEYSILLKFDTFNGSGVNGGNFYYNWIPNDRGGNAFTSSGGYETLDMKPDFSGELKFEEERPVWGDLPYEEFKKLGDAHWERLNSFREENGLIKIWSGDHDCREAVKNNINLLAQNGRFMKKWFKAPFLWLCHYEETKGKYDYEKINQSRIDKFPKYVREAMGL
jgi:hypothetical protein